VLKLRGGKPVILFYPPTVGPLAEESSFETTTTVSLHKACSFTTLLPKPEIAADGRSITWNAVVQQRKKHCDEKSPARLTVGGRQHGYLFWEFTNKTDAPESDFVSSAIGYESVVDDASNAYVLEGMDEYEDWCGKMLDTLGLGVREQDDFITFWAKSVAENGPFVIARVVPEKQLEKCCPLTVKARCSSSSDVPTIVKRVYVTMIVCKTLPSSGIVDKMHNWKKEKTNPITLPTDLSESFPIKYDSEALTVVEWGGILLSL